MPADAELLRRYADDHSEDSFAELVRRHLDGVYSSALRRVGGDRHLAQDVAQVVFIALARQSRALATHPFLTAWLYATTRNEAANTVRRERRRKAREAAAAMNETNASSSTDSPAETDWSQLSPILDDAIDALSETDRAVILLRYVDKKPFADIGAKLRLTEDAARMRVDRALDKLRTVLIRRGLTSSSAALGLVLTSNAVAAAPASLVASVTAAALVTTPLTVSAGAGILAFMSTTKTTLTLAALACLIAASVATRQIVRTQSNRALLENDRRISSSSLIRHGDTKAEAQSMEKVAGSTQLKEPVATQTFVPKTPAGTFIFTPGKRPSLEEYARLKQEEIIETVAAYDRAYEPFYNQLGLNDAGKRQKFLMLKAKQVEELKTAKQATLRAYVGKNREERDREMAAATENIHSSFIARVRETFGETTANAVHLFESSQKAAYKQLTPLIAPASPITPPTANSPTAH